MKIMRRVSSREKKKLEKLKRKIIQCDGENENGVVKRKIKKIRKIKKN